MQFTRKNAGSSHSYWYTPDPVDGLDQPTIKLPGVTTIIGILDKPALVNWAAQQSASYAIEHWGELSNMDLLTRANKIERGRFESNKRAIIRGHTLHAMAEKLLNGEAVETVDQTTLDDITAIARLLEKWQINPVLTEAPLCNTDDLWAGTCDVVADVPKLGRIMLDYKTGKGVYDEVALQLAAYARANLRLEGIGKTAVQLPMIAGIDQNTGYVIHIQDGVAKLHPVRIDDDVYQTFLSLVDIWWHWTQVVSWSSKGSDVFNPPVGDPLIYETTEGNYHGHH